MSEFELNDPQTGSRPPEPPNDNATIAYINERCEKDDQGKIEIGQYLLEHYFANDPEKVKDKNPFKNQSLRGLAKRSEEISLSLSTLSKAIGVVAQDKLLHESVDVSRLSFTAKAELLSLPDDQEKKLAAQRVVGEGLSTRAVRKLVKAARKQNSPDGTEETTRSFTKYLNALKSLKEIPCLSPESRADLDSSLQAQLGQQVYDAVELLNHHIQACKATLESLRCANPQGEAVSAPRHLEAI